jgi:spermidine synthase/Tfp pilus assembly protein PilF
MSLLFVLSGATGLTYELIWIKRFAHIWGSSSLAMATVVACFLLGLGVGAQLIGRIADRLRAPLRWYGFAELTIGGLALVVPWQLALLARVGASIEGSLPDLSAARLGLRFVVTLLVIGPPSLLMGGTLPLLIRQGTTRSLSDATGWLYGLNTLGAALGCYLAGFHLLPSLGLLWTNNLAAAINIAIAGAALALWRLAAGAEPSATTAKNPAVDRSTPGSESASALRQLLVLWAALATGCAALVLQMTWARQLAVTLGGSTYGYSATLFTVLVGIAVGGLIYHLALRRVARLEPWAALVTFVVAASTVAGQQQLPWLCDQVGMNRALRADLWGNALVCVAASMVLELIPSIGAGVLFPLLVQLTRQSAAHVGQVVGKVYLWNTAGSIIGASATALVLFPRVGTAGAVTLAIGLYALTIVMLLVMARWRLGPLAWGSLAGSVLCMVLAAGWLGIGGPADPRLTNFGMYLYGYSPAARRLDGGGIMLFEEGPSANVLVLNSKPSRTLRVNGKVDAGTVDDMATQLGLAYMPQAFHPEAKDVLVIGFGSGATAGASLLFADNRVVCCEIEPAVFAASSLFNDINHAPEKSPRLEMIFDDGRSYLQRTDRQFDLIISEPSNPWIAGVGNLFTREFFEAVQRNLRPGGVLAQWIQSYQFSVDEYALIVRTLRSVFPHCGLVALAGGVDTILLASDRPLIFDREAQQQFAARLARAPSVESDLRQFFGAGDFRSVLLRHFVADETGLDSFLQAAGSGPVNTDLNLRLEFTAPLRMFGPPIDDELLSRIVSLRTTAWLDSLAQSMDVPRDAAMFRWALATQALAEKRAPEAEELLRQAIDADPQMVGAYIDLAKVYIAADQNMAAIDVMRRAVPLRPKDAALRGSLAGLLVGEGKLSEAIAMYREALEIDPELLVARMNLAWILATAADERLRDADEAVRLAQQACELTGYRDGHCLEVLAAALAEQGDYSRAVHLAAQAVEELQAMGESTAGAQARLSSYRALMSAAGSRQER